MCTKTTVYSEEFVINNCMHYKSMSKMWHIMLLYVYRKLWLKGVWLPISNRKLIGSLSASIFYYVFNLIKDTSMKSLLLKFWKDEEGATAIEYALIAGLIAVAIIGALTLLGDNITALFDGISVRLGEEAEKTTATGGAVTPP